MIYFQGIKVIVERPKPRMVISEKVSVTNEFRHEINEWMIEFFWYQKPLINKNNLIVFTDPSTNEKTIFCSQEQLALLESCNDQ